MVLSTEKCVECGRSVEWPCVLNVGEALGGYLHSMLCVVCACVGCGIGVCCVMWVWVTKRTSLVSNAAVMLF